MDRDQLWKELEDLSHQPGIAAKVRLYLVNGTTVEGWLLAGVPRFIDESFQNTVCLMDANEQKTEYPVGQISKYERLG